MMFKLYTLHANLAGDATNNQAVRPRMLCAGTDTSRHAQSGREVPLGSISCMLYSQCITSLYSRVHDTDRSGSH